MVVTRLGLIAWWSRQYNAATRTEYPVTAAAFQKLGFGRFDDLIDTDELIFLRDLYDEILELACIENPNVIKKVLDHLDAKSRALASANQPPESRALP